ncbi:MAG: cytochrome b/b6 domain-containing protein [Pseudomonadales bacterium]
MKQAAISEPAQRGVLIWDWPLRLFHWLLTLAIAFSWLTAELGVEYTQWHMRSGYCVIGLLAFRLLWGLLGSRYARFGAWLPRPAAIFAYLPTLRHRDSRRSLGHNPLGALSVWLLLGLTALQALTGLFVDDDILYVGLYQPAVSAALSERLTNLHHANFDWLLAAIALHVAAILFYLLFKRQNLIMTMISGRQPAAQSGSAGARPVAWWRVLLAVGIAVAIVWCMISFAPEPVYDDYF